jgi:hypothetical protein
MFTHAAEIMATHSHKLLLIWKRVSNARFLGTARIITSPTVSGFSSFIPNEKEGKFLIHMHAMSPSMHLHLQENLINGMKDYTLFVGNLAVGKPTLLSSSAK